VIVVVFVTAGTGSSVHDKMSGDDQRKKMDTRELSDEKRLKCGDGLFSLFLAPRHHAF
jgi:hypothetical protein